MDLQTAPILLALLASCTSPAESFGYDPANSTERGWTPPVLPESVIAAFTDDASLKESAWFIQGSIDPPLPAMESGWLPAILPLDPSGAPLGTPLTGDDRLGAANGASFTAYARRRSVPPGTASLALIYELGPDSRVSVRVLLPRPEAVGSGSD